LSKTVSIIDVGKVTIGNDSRVAETAAGPASCHRTTRLAAVVHIDTYSDALVALATAGVIVPLARRLGVSPVLGFLGAGAVLGPAGLGGLVGDQPILKWVAVSEPKSLAIAADLGLVFLLFLIGLELSFERLKTMRRLIFGLGGLQVMVSTAAIALVVTLAGGSLAVAIVLGACLALSSTAIVIELLSMQGRLATSAGRTSFAVLLAQDLAVVPILVFISLLGAGTGGSVLASLALAFANALVALAVIVMLGRLLLRPLFRLVAQTHSSELFIAAILLVIIATGVVAGAAGLSMALGAFVAGLLLAETEFRKAIEAQVQPFKGLLLGLFFFTVGMTIDIRQVMASPLIVLGSVVSLVALKAGIIVLLARWFRLGWPATVETALLLGPGGEFAFVGIGLAASLGLLAQESAATAFAVTALTMVLIPLMSDLARRIDPLLAPPKADDLDIEAAPPNQRDHAIIIGHGRVGEVVSSLLAEHGVPYTVIESDPAAVTRARRRGRSVYYGRATDVAFLRACGLMSAKGVIITIHTQAAIDEIIALVRSERPDLPIVARARDAAHARHLYGVGVSDAVPETIEASLQLSEAALVGLGVPTGPVIASIHAKRDEFRDDLQQAARLAGRAATRAIRAKVEGA
jgi:CPA2 family monovalent cation:H+ antiporter-2